MASNPNVLTDQSRLSRVDTFIFKIESALNLLGGFTIFALVILTVTNVLGRWLFDFPVTGYIDWIEQAMAFFAFLGIAYCQRLGAHIRMDLVIGAIHGRLHWLSELISALLMLLVTVLLIYGSYLHAWRAFDIGDSSMDIGLPTWPAKAVIPIALSFLALRLFIQIFAYIRVIVKGAELPVAIPLPEKALNQAMQESAVVLPEKNNNSQ